MPTAAFTSTTPVRVLLYSHDSVGLGHIRRNLSLAGVLARRLPAVLGRPVTGILCTSAPQAQSFPPPSGFDHLVIPGMAKTEGQWRPRRLDVGFGALRDLRSSLLSAAIVDFAPDLVIVDRHVWGMRDELRPALTRLRAERPGTRIVLGLRDVLDEPKVAAAEWGDGSGVADIRAVYDEIWVYGDANVRDLRTSGEVPAGLSDLIHHLGYLSLGRPRTIAPAMTEPYVLTMAGGGADGIQLTEAAAAAPVPTKHRHLVVTGPQMPAEDRRRVERLAGPRTTVLERVPDGLAMVRGASAVISMGGYNSVSEIMATDRPALLAPRLAPRQEQLIRASTLADRGAVDTTGSDPVLPEAVGAWFDARVGSVAPRTSIELRGLARTTTRAAALLAPAMEVAHAS